MQSPFKKFSLNMIPILLKTLQNLISMKMFYKSFLIQKPMYKLLFSWFTKQNKKLEIKQSWLEVKPVTLK